jgi:two-component system response regulator PilR (NtrC family)
VPGLSAQALRALQDYPFPGNVRELENVLERALALLSGDEIGVEDLHLSPVEVETEGTPAAQGGGPLQDYLDRVERQAVVDALQKTHFNRTAAAKLLGVTFRSLRYRMERLGLKE